MRIGRSAVVTTLVLTGLTGRAPAAAQSGKPATALVHVEQDGRRIEPAAGVVEVKRAPFTLVIAMPPGTEVHAHASENSAAVEAARKSQPLGDFFIEGGSLAIDLLNTSRTLYLAAEDGPVYHVWFVEALDDHTFDSVALHGTTRVARYTVAKLWRPDRTVYDVERFPGREIFAVFRLMNRDGTEVRREVLRITLMSAASDRGAAALVEKADTPIRLPQDIPPPKKVKHVDPIYNELARAARVEGVVQIEAVIAPDGSVRDAKVVRSIPLLDPAALEAVKQWQFEPVLVNGVPRAVVITVSVNFSLR